MQSAIMLVKQNIHWIKIGAIKISTAAAAISGNEW
jgi:hypothetical protein